MSQNLSRVRGLYLAITLMIGLICVCQAHAAKKSEMPSTVLASFAKSYKGIEAVGYDSETSMGRTLYEIQTKSGKFEKNYIYLADGSLMQIEEQIAVSSLPEVVSAAAKKANANYKITDAEKITRGAKVEYEVTLENGTSEVEVLISSEGKILPINESEQDEESGAEDDESK